MKDTKDVFKVKCFGMEITRDKDITNIQDVLELTIAYLKLVISLGVGSNNKLRHIRGHMVSCSRIHIP